MADQVTPTDAMADIVNGPTRNIQPSERPYRAQPHRPGVRRTSDLADAGSGAAGLRRDPQAPGIGQDAVGRSALGLTTRATLPNQPKQASIADLEGGTIFDQLAARAVMISRVAEEIEHNLALSLSAMR